MESQPPVSAPVFSPPRLAWMRRRCDFPNTWLAFCTPAFLLGSLHIMSFRNCLNAPPFPAFTFQGSECILVFFFLVRPQGMASVSVSGPRKRGSPTTSYFLRLCRLTRPRVPGECWGAGTGLDSSWSEFSWWILFVRVSQWNASSGHGRWQPYASCGFPLSTRASRTTCLLLETKATLTNK